MLMHAGKAHGEKISRHQRGNEPRVTKFERYGLSLTVKEHEILFGDLSSCGCHAVDFELNAHSVKIWSRDETLSFHKSAYVDTDHDAISIRFPAFSSFNRALYAQPYRPLYPVKYCYD